MKGFPLGCHSHGGGRLFLQLIWAEANHRLDESPACCLVGVMWQQGAVSGIICDWRIVSDSNEGLHSFK